MRRPSLPFSRWLQKLLSIEGSPDKVDLFVSVHILDIGRGNGTIKSIPLINWSS